MPSGRPEFSRTVTGGTGRPVSTSAEGTVETDNYPTGDAFDLSGGSLPVTIDPPATMQEIVITASGDDTVLRITTTGGATFDLPLNGGTGTFDKWSIDILEVRGSADVAGGWAGE